ncbi:MAG: hypothetical protein ABIK48_05470 [candidate division WOR-3 bacterium]
MDVSAEITGLKYKPYLTRELKSYLFQSIGEALKQQGAFLITFKSQNQLAVSWWVSPKRTRSYPYARVYDTLSFPGRKITIIPVYKDEGADGDRDFLQWDTVSLMSLLGVYVIISYYDNAERNINYKNKITNQRFAINHILREINKLLSYQSDALHWNLEQLEQVGIIAHRALRAYKTISEQTGVQMHSTESAQKIISELSRGRENFIAASRTKAQHAQYRESVTIQPKESVSGKKATLTIRNYLGGMYYFTCDEVELRDRKIRLIECKHSRNNVIPSIDDIKDGLLKMILLVNLKNVRIGDQKYLPSPMLKLTSGCQFKPQALKPHQRDILKLLKQEAQSNNFSILLNGKNLSHLAI